MATRPPSSPPDRVAHTTRFPVGSKAAGFIIALRILEPFLESGSAFIQSQTVFVLLILSGLTLLYGNLAAIPQGNFKRLMAYSSIAHAGFLLLVIAAWQNDPEANSLTSAQVVSFYLATYFLMTMGVFFAVCFIAFFGSKYFHFNSVKEPAKPPRVAQTL